VIRHAGLSEVSVAEIKAASQVFSASPRCRTVTTLADRESDDVGGLLPGQTASALFPIIL